MHLFEQMTCSPPTPHKSVEAMPLTLLLGVGFFCFFEGSHRYKNKSLISDHSKGWESEV